MSKSNVPLKPLGVAIPRFLETLRNDEQRTAYLQAKAIQLKRKINAVENRDPSWLPTCALLEMEIDERDVLDVDDEGDVQRNRDDDEFIDHTLKPKPDPAYKDMPPELLEEGAKRKRIPAKQYLNVDFGESDELEKVPPMVTTWKRLKSEMGNTMRPHTARYDNYVRCMNDRKFMKVTSNEEWIDGQKQFYCCYRTLQEIYAIVKGYITDFERIELDRQRMAMMQTVEIKQNDFNEGDIIIVNVPHMDLYGWSLQVFKTYPEMIEVYHTGDWPDDHHAEISEALTQWRDGLDFVRRGVVTGRSDCWTVLMLPKIKGWEYELDLSEAPSRESMYEVDRDYRASLSEDSSSECISSEASSSDESSDSDGKKRPKKSQEPLTKKEKAQMAQFLAELRAKSKASAGAVGGAAKGPAKRSTPKAPLSVGQTLKLKSKDPVSSTKHVAQSKSKPVAPAGVAAGAAAGAAKRPAKAIVMSAGQRLRMSCGHAPVSSTKPVEQPKPVAPAGAAKGAAAGPAKPKDLPLKAQPERKSVDSDSCDSDDSDQPLCTLKRPL